MTYAHPHAQLTAEIAMIGEVVLLLVLAVALVAVTRLVLNVSRRCRR